MIGRFRLWWTGRAPRERVLLLIMFGLLGITIVWLLLIRPVGDALADARARHDRAVIARAGAEAQAQAIAVLERGGGAKLTGPIVAFVGQRAEEAGFTVARVDPLGADRATIVINAARAAAFFSWIADLERRDGLIVDALSARVNSDQTLSVEATFRPRAS